MNHSFSIIISLYNKAAYIQRAINSALAQSYQTFEVIVVDDCSIDNGAEIVADYQDERVRLIRHVENRGVSQTRNTGIASAKYDLVSFMDADDYWKPDYLGSIASLIEKFPNCDVYATSFEYHTRKGRIDYPKIPKIPWGWAGILEDYFSVAVTGPPFQTSSVTVRKNAILEVGGFPEELRTGEGEDIYTWAILALDHQIAFIHQPKTVYSVGVSEQASSSNVRRDDKVIARFKNILDTGLVPENRARSFRDYFSNMGIINARTSILYGSDGTQARVILKLLSPIPKRFLGRWWWHYFWSFSHRTFRSVVRLKERFKQ